VTRDFVWVVCDPDHPDTPVAGVWQEQKDAFDHRRPGYVVLKMNLNTDYCESPPTGNPAQ
jgi:hypothetical protein